MTSYSPDAPTITLIRGLPGSGKTTLATKLMSNDNKHYEADMFMVDPDGNYKFDKDKLSFCHKMCQKYCESAMSRRENVIISNTFVKKWEMKTYLDMATLYGYKVEIIECKDSYPNVHGVPKETIDRMRANWEEL